jgi:hypothetical protein
MDMYTVHKQLSGSFFNVFYDLVGSYPDDECKPVLIAKAESKEKHGAWSPTPELTITSPYVHSRVDSSTFPMGNPIPESTLTLCQS